MELAGAGMDAAGDLAIALDQQRGHSPGEGRLRHLCEVVQPHTF